MDSVPVVSLLHSSSGEQPRHLASLPSIPDADQDAQEQTYFQAGQRRTYQEMRQKPAPRDTFFSLKSEPQTFLRPSSVTTEFVDTDFDDDTVSETGNNSPRVSLQSVRRRIWSATVNHSTMGKNPKLTHWSRSPVSPVLQRCRRMTRCPLRDPAGKPSLAAHLRRSKVLVALTCFGDHSLSTPRNSS